MDGCVAVTRTCHDSVFEESMPKPTQRARPRPAAPLAPSYSSPLAILALGMLGGYAALVLLPATGATHAPLWQIALGATVVTLLAAALALRNCFPLSTTPLRGRLVAGLCALGCLTTCVFTYQLYVYETEPSRRATAIESGPGDAAKVPPLVKLIARPSSRRSTN